MESSHSREESRRSTQQGQQQGQSDAARARLASQDAEYAAALERQMAEEAARESSARYDNSGYDNRGRRDDQWGYDDHRYQQHAYDGFAMPPTQDDAAVARAYEQSERDFDRAERERFQEDRELQEAIRLSEAAAGGGGPQPSAGPTPPRRGERLIESDDEQVPISEPLSREEQLARNIDVNNRGSDDAMNMRRMQEEVERMQQEMFANAGGRIPMFMPGMPLGGLNMPWGVAGFPDAPQRRGGRSGGHGRSDSRSRSRSDDEEDEVSRAVRLSKEEFDRSTREAERQEQEREYQESLELDRAVEDSKRALEAEVARRQMEEEKAAKAKEEEARRDEERARHADEAVRAEKRNERSQRANRYSVSALPKGAAPAGSMRIAFQMPDGKRVVQSFHADAMLGHLFSFVDVQLNDSKDPCTYVLTCPHPAREIRASEDLATPLAATGLSGAVLHVRPVVAPAP